MEFIQIYTKASRTGTPILVTITINISGYQAPCIMPDILYLLGPHINLTGGRFTTGTDLSESIFSFVNRTTSRWSAPYFTTDECASKYTYVDEFSTSFSRHDFESFLYHDRISHSQIILA